MSKPIDRLHPTIFLALLALMCIPYLTSSQNCIQVNTPANFSSAPFSNYSCGSSFYIENPTTTGLAVGSTTGSITPTSVGTIYLHAEPCGEAFTIEVVNINTSFNYVAGSGCYSVSLNAVVGANVGCTYSYFIDGTWHGADANGHLNYSFNSGGNYLIQLKVQCGTCTLVSPINNVNVPGSIPELSFQGDVYLESTPMTNWSNLVATEEISYDTTLIKYCVIFQNGVTTEEFPLNLSNVNNTVGATNFNILFDGVNVYNNPSNPPPAYYAIPTPTTQGYHLIKYSFIGANGCPCFHVYKFYIAKYDPQNMTFTPSPANNCIGINETFGLPSFGGLNLAQVYPPGTVITLIIACHSSGSTPLDTLWIQTWSDPSLVPNNIQWEPTFSSCGCLDSGDPVASADRFKVFGYARNPCDSSNPPGTVYFKVTGAIADFYSNPNYCQGNQIFHWPSEGSCTPQHTWIAIDPSGASNQIGTSTTADANVNLNQSGIWHVSHDVNTATCGSDHYAVDICVSDNMNGIIDWDNNIDNSSICLPAGGYSIHPSFAIDPNLFLCPGVAVTYSWSVSTSNCSPCSNSGNCYSILNGDSPNPTITLNCACDFIITCQVLGCDQASYTLHIKVVASPEIDVSTSCPLACTNGNWPPSGCATVNACNGTNLSTYYTFSGNDYALTDYITFTTSGNYPITIVASTLNSGITCSSDTTFTVVVADPAIPNITNVQSDFCQGSTITLTANLVGVTFQYESPVGTWNNIVGNSYVINATTTFRAIFGTDACQTVSTPFVATMFSEPIITINAPPSPPCVGSVANYSVNMNPASANYNYQWILNGNNVGTNSTTYNYSPQNGDLLNVSVDYGIGCNTTGLPLLVTLASVTANIDCASIPNPYCQDMAAIPVPTLSLPSNVFITDTLLDNVPMNGNSMIDPSSLSPGNHIVKFLYSDNYGCSYESSCPFEIIAAQTLTITYTDNLTICSMSSIDFNTSINIPQSNIWSCIECPSCIDNDGLFSAPSVINPTNYTIICDAECILADTVVVTINPTPSVSADSFTSICSNQTQTLTGNLSSTVDSYYWVVDSTVLSNDIFDPILLGLNAGTNHTVYLVGSNIYNCTAIDTFNVQINALPPGINIPASYCLNQPYSIANIGNGVTFSLEFYHTQTPFETLGPFTSAQNINFNYAGFYDYSMSIMTASGCSIDQEGQIEIISTPVADVDLGPYLPCNPVCTFINNSTPTNATVSWNGDLTLPNPNSFIPSNGPYIVPESSVNQDYQFYFTINNQCGADQDSVTVHYEADPGFALDNPTEVCGGSDLLININFNYPIYLDSVTVSTDYPVFGTHTYLAYPPVPIVISTNQVSTPQVIHVTVIAYNNCNSHTEYSGDILISPASNVLDLVLSYDVPLCHGSLIHAHISETSAVPGSPYLDISPEFFIYDYIPSDTTYVLQISDSAVEGVHSISANLNSNGCPFTDSDEFTIGPFAQPFFSSIPACMDSNIQVMNESIPNGPDTYYSWSILDSVFSHEINLDTLWSFFTNNDLSLSVDNPFYCSSTYTDTVQYYPNPTIDFSYQSTQAFNQSHEVTVLNPEVQFHNQTENAAYYTWNFEDDGNSTSHLTHPIHTFPAIDGSTFKVCLEAESEHGCKAESCQNVNIASVDGVFVPNAFTPDGDGINDVFRPVVTGIDEKNYLFQIYNRWGDLIFETSEVNDVWTGEAYDNGKYFVPNGAYAWMLTYQNKEGQNVALNGFVIMVR